MDCVKCGEQIPKGEEMNHRGQILCEDCYVEAVSVPKTCDVAAVYSAKTARKKAGQQGVEGLTDLQKKLYQFVEENGRVTPEALGKQFNLSPMELQRQFATLRHCELLRGTKIDGTVYITLMQEDSRTGNTNG